MLTKPISDVDMLKYIYKSARISLNTEQYALLSRADSNWGVSTGIISFSQHANDAAHVGTFTISNPGLTPDCTTSNTNFKFYRVSLDGIKYIAVKKPTDRMDGYVIVQYIQKSALAEFKLESASKLTNITAL